MTAQSKSHLTDALLIIPLKQFSIEKIVTKKLQHYLEYSPNKNDIFKNFYNPVEQAVLETCLVLFKGNQSRVADFLQINRNTLKKKLNTHGIFIKTLLLKNQTSSFFQDIYVSQIDQLDLLEICRLKMSLLKKSPHFLEENPMETICESIKKIIIEISLKYFKNNQLKTALFLKISRNTLKKKLDVRTTFKEGTP